MAEREAGTYYDRVGRHKPRASKPYKERSVNLETQAAYQRRLLKEQPKVVRSRRRSGSYRFVSGKATAKRRGFVWTLTKAEHTALLLLPCHYCHGLLNGTGCGLDRVENDKGYTLQNVVPCCFTCNNAKGSMPLAVFKSWVKRVASVFANNEEGGVALAQSKSKEEWAGHASHAAASC